MKGVAVFRNVSCLQLAFSLIVVVFAVSSARAADANVWGIEMPPAETATIAFTGFLNGYVEPCGCAGLDKMKGGLGRRHALFQQLRQRGWNLIPIDAGNLNKGASPLEEHKFQFVAEESMRLMGYQASGLGRHELLFPPTTLLLYTADTAGSPKRYTSANVALFDFDATILAPYRIAESGGVRVCVVSVLGASQRQSFGDDGEILFADPIAKLRETLPSIEKRADDWCVLIVHGSTKERESILAAFPNGTFDFVVPSETPAEPPLAPQRLACGAWLIEVGLKGSHVVLASVGKKKSPDAVRFHRIALDGRFTTSPEVFAAMQSYQDYLKDIGWSGLGLKPQPLPSSATQPLPSSEMNIRFVGSTSCKNCHEVSYAVWKGTSHARAVQTLIEVSKPARQYDPECIACHVVGWNPQGATPYIGGFESCEKTPLLASVGCESCHGPGERHVAAETNGSEAIKSAARLAVRLPLVAARNHCIQCHDHENSPEFDFDAYWTKVQHSEQ